MVPEIASRVHVVNLIPVLDAALAQAGATLDDVDGIAVTRGPGLVGALLVGVQAAKAIAWARGLPLVGVNHLEGHLSRGVPRRPTRAPRVSAPRAAGVGRALGARDRRATRRYELLGATRDDAAGEAFDKVGKMLGLGYPAGPVRRPAGADGRSERGRAAAGDARARARLQLQRPEDRGVDASCSDTGVPDGAGARRPVRELSGGGGRAARAQDAAGARRARAAASCVSPAAWRATAGCARRCSRCGRARASSCSCRRRRAAPTTRR